MQPLKNQVALITGGGRGIGAATAEAALKLVRHALRVGVHGGGQGE